MRAVVVFRLRTELRHRRGSLLVLVGFVAVLGGLVLATAAGARRTSSAYDRLIDETNAPELLVSPPGGPGIDPTPFYEAIATLPDVRGVATFAGVPLLPREGTPSARLAGAFSGIGVVASLDEAPALDIGQPLLLEGRLPRATEVDEVLVSARMAAAEGIRSGDVIDVVLVRSPVVDPAGGTATPADGIPLSLTVTGVGVRFDEVIPFGDLNATGSVMATPSLAALVERGDWNFEGAQVDVVPGADLERLAATIQQLSMREELDTGGPAFIADQTAATRGTTEAIRPLAVALALAALALAVVSSLVVTQAMSRMTRRASSHVDALRSLGSTRGDRVAFALARAAIVGAAGAVGAVVLAVALSGRFPVGVARRAEPDPGLRVDAPVLLVGAVVITLVTVIGALPAAIDSLPRRRDRKRSSALLTAAANAGLPPAATQGIRFAAVGGGARPIPLRSTLVAASLAIVAVVATVSFGASLGALIDTPDRYGQGWDRMVDAQFGPAPVGRVVDAVPSVAGVRGVAAGNYGTAVVNGVQVPAFDLRVVDGDLSIGLLEGRAASRADEIVLGGQITDKLGVGVGDTVEVDVNGATRRMTLTGRGVFPQMGQGSFSTTGLGVGAQLAADTFTSFGDVGDVPPGYELDGRRYNFVVIRTDAPPSTLDATLATIEAAAIADGAFVFVRHEQPPTKIRDLDRVRVVPATMAATLTLIAAAALAHVLVSSVRERRRELALLRTLGFSSPQLYASVAWQASLMTVTALAVGTPLGLALGRVVWHRFARGLATAAPAETPWQWLLVALGATFVVANLVAALPGRLAARTQPALILRDD